MKNLRMLVTLVLAVPALLCRSAARADPKAEALLHQIEAAAGSVRTMTADVTRTDMAGKSVEATLRVMKPNYVSLVYTNLLPDAAPAYVLSDGTTLWRYPDSAKREYKTEKADPRGSGTVDWLDGIPIQSLFGLKKALKAGGLDAAAFRYEGTRTWDGDSFQILRNDFEEDAKRYTAWLYVGSDHLIHRLVGTFYIQKPDGSPRMFEVALHNVRINVPMTTTQFTYTPPGDTQRFVPKPLPATGTAAPDFRAEYKNGNVFRLSDLRGKVVVIDFWATWCLPCVRGMKHVNSVAAQFKEKGVVVLAVNVMDNKAAYNAWLQRHPEYDALVFALDTSPVDQDPATPLYQPSGVPTQYVLDKNGRIVASFIGYTGPTPELAKAVKKAIAVR